jgi:hypothetical protein
MNGQNPAASSRNLRAGTVLSLTPAGFPSRHPRLPLETDSSALTRPEAGLKPGKVAWNIPKQALSGGRSGGASSKPREKWQKVSLSRRNLRLLFPKAGELF